MIQTHNDLYFLLIGGTVTFEREKEREREREREQNNSEGQEKVIGMLQVKKSMENQLLFCC